MKQKYVFSVLLVLLVAVMVLSSGCAAPGLTAKEVHRRHVETFRNDLWQFQDDIDSVLMIDRPSRLSPWMVR